MRYGKEADFMGLGIQNLLLLSQIKNYNAEALFKFQISERKNVKY